MDWNNQLKSKSLIRVTAEQLRELHNNYSPPKLHCSHCNKVQTSLAPGGLCGTCSALFYPGDYTLGDTTGESKVRDDYDIGW